MGSLGAPNSRSSYSATRGTNAPCFATWSPLLPCKLNPPKLSSLSLFVSNFTSARSWLFLEPQHHQLRSSLSLDCILGIAQSISSIQFVYPLFSSYFAHFLSPLTSRAWLLPNASFVHSVSSLPPSFYHNCYPSVPPSYLISVACIICPGNFYLNLSFQFSRRLSCPA